jgi:hypothetical protein
MPLGSAEHCTELPTLLSTKFNQTLVIAHLVPDPPARTTGAALPRQSTLISALACYGKTILVSRLIQDNAWPRSLTNF